MLVRCHQLWAPRFCQSALRLSSQNLLFGRLRWLQSGQIQLPEAGAATASTDPAPLSRIKQSSYDRSATNAYQGCFDACASMTNNDDRQHNERDKICREKKMVKQYGTKNTCHN